MSFARIINDINIDALHEKIYSVTEVQVEQLLISNNVTIENCYILFAPTAKHYLEQLATRSAAITTQRFGRVIQLYAPLYISNSCINSCVYCGFSAKHDYPRTTLALEQVLMEAKAIAAEGFRHILLVTGEDRNAVPPEALARIITELRNLFHSIAIEVYPMPHSDYELLTSAGADGIALYQETYLKNRYPLFHPAGPKSNFVARLDAIENAALANFRSLGIGFLLGLSDWRLDAYLMALHGEYLMRKFWRAKLALSFPRIRDTYGHFSPNCAVSDTELLQMLCAFRLLFNDAEIVLSTREDAKLRDGLLGLGITRMSAGSKTNPGAYSFQATNSEPQFSVSDSRSPSEIVNVIRSKGLEPVWKDFDAAFFEY